MIINPYAFASGGGGFVLNYSSDGDENGVVFYIATAGGADTWANPHTAGRVVVTRSSSLVGSAADLVDRATNNGFSNFESNPWVAIDLGLGRQLIPNRYSLRNRDESAYYLPSWKLQGSNDAADNTVSGLNAATWDELDTRTTTALSGVNAWYSPELAGVTVGYRWFRIYSLESPFYLTLAEFEFYGTLITP